MYSFVDLLLRNEQKRKICSWYFLDGQGSNNSSGPSMPSSRSTSLETTIFPHDPFVEETVKELEALGFTGAQVIAELRRFNGDKAQATAALFAKSLKF